MTTRHHKGTQALLAAAIAAMVVMPVAFAGAAGPGAAKKQIKALSKRVAALESSKAPTTLPPRGPAGGDLTGNYPNPEIGLSKVGSPEIADGSIGRRTSATTRSASSSSPPARSERASSRARSRSPAPV